MVQKLWQLGSYVRTRSYAVTTVGEAETLSEVGDYLKACGVLEELISRQVLRLDATRSTGAWMNYGPQLLDSIPRKSPNACREHFSVTKLAVAAVLTAGESRRPPGKLPTHLSRHSGNNC